MMREVTAKIDSVEQAMAFSCFLMDYFRRPVVEIDLSVTVERDGTYTLGARPFDLIDTVLYKGFFDSFEEYLGLFGKLGGEACHECENYKRGKDILYEDINADGGFFGKTRIWCPATVVKADAGEIKGDVAASPAAFFRSHDGGLHKGPAYGSIEKNIMVLVRALNFLDGIRTIFSCAGHRMEIASTDLSARMPFVSFYASLGRAMEVFTVLSGLDLHYEWRLKAYIVNECPRRSPYIFWEVSPKGRWFFRKRLNHDIERIAEGLYRNVATQKR